MKKITRRQALKTSVGLVATAALPILPAKALPPGLVELPLGVPPLTIKDSDYHIGEVTLNSVRYCDYEVGTYVECDGRPFGALYVSDLSIRWRFYLAPFYDQLHSSSDDAETIRIRCLRKDALCDNEINIYYWRDEYPQLDVPCDPNRKFKGDDYRRQFKSVKDTLPYAIQLVHEFKRTKMIKAKMMEFYKTLNSIVTKRQAVTCSFS